MAPLGHLAVEVAHRRGLGPQDRAAAGGGEAKLMRTLSAPPCASCGSTDAYAEAIEVRMPGDLPLYPTISGTCHCRRCEGADRKAYPLTDAWEDRGRRGSNETQGLICHSAVERQVIRRRPWSKFWGPRERAEWVALTFDDDARQSTGGA